MSDDFEHCGLCDNRFPCDLINAWGGPSGEVSVSQSSIVVAEVLLFGEKLDACERCYFSGKLTARNPTELAHAFYQFGLGFDVAGRHDDAVLAIRKSLILHEFADALESLATLLDSDESKLLYERALKIDPSHRLALLNSKRN